MEIYMIENRVNGKKYIGQTVLTFNERYNFSGVGAERVFGYLKFREENQNTYKDKLYHNNHLLNAMKKYGVENFEVSIIDTAESVEELNAKEIYWIDFHDAYTNGYNKSLGGGNNKGWTPSDETRELWSKTRKGVHAGENNPNYGQKHSKVTRCIMSNNRKGKGTGGNHPKARAVINLDTLEIFETMTAAAKSVGLDVGNLTEVCQRKKRGKHGVRKLVGGYRWMYYDEYLEKGDVVGEYKNKRHKPIRNLDTGEIFSTIKEAADKCDLDTSTLSKVCKGRLKSTGGYRWEYYTKE